MNIEDFKSEELKDVIRTILDKMPGEEISKEALEKIKEIQLRYKYANGEKTDIDLEEIQKLPNIETLIIGGTSLTKREYEILSHMPKISTIKFYDCTFDESQPVKFSDTVKSIRIIDSQNIESIDFSDIEDLGMMRCKIDFSKLNLQAVKRLVLANCDINNMTDLLDLQSLQFALFDGSKVQDENGKALTNIERKPSVEFSFKPDAKIYER